MFKTVAIASLLAFGSALVAVPAAEAQAVVVKKRMVGPMGGSKTVIRKMGPMGGMKKVVIRRGPMGGMSKTVIRRGPMGGMSKTVVRRPM